MITEISLLVMAWAAKLPFVCGDTTLVNRPYGRVELRVDCRVIEGRMWAAEYKGKKLHGVAQGFDLASGMRRDSAFYLDGEAEGLLLVWDTLGNRVGRTRLKRGKEEGLAEGFFPSGLPREIRYFKAGKSHGPWDEWWPNGNRKWEYVARRGIPILGTEYYPNGRRAVIFVDKDEPEVKSIFEKKTIEVEAWAPDGRPAGKVVEGNGEWLRYPSDGELKGRKVMREVIKDSLTVKSEYLDSAQVEEWFRTKGRIK